MPLCCRYCIEKISGVISPPVGWGFFLHSYICMVLSRSAAFRHFCCPFRFLDSSACTLFFRLPRVAILRKCSILWRSHVCGMHLQKQAPAEPAVQTANGNLLKVIAPPWPPSGNAALNDGAATTASAQSKPPGLKQPSIGGFFQKRAAGL
jgi:hypothetical protein